MYIRRLLFLEALLDALAARYCRCVCVCIGVGTCMYVCRVWGVCV